MQRLARLTLIAYALLAGCAHTQRKAPVPSTGQSTLPANTSAAARAAEVAPERPSPSPPVAEPQPRAAAPSPVQAPAPAATKPPSAARAKGQPRQDATAPVAAAPAAPAAALKPQLDLNSLQQRLRNTQAIGVFTKLSLKNQVDDLLNGFRGYYAGHVPPTMDDLRQRYDGLLLKVVTLVQDDDASLASAISASRGAIWERLSNRESFQAI